MSRIYTNHEERYSEKRIQEVSYTIKKSRRNRRMIKFAFSLFLVMGIFLTTGGIFSYANAKTQKESDTPATYKYYTSIRIESGDTLNSIARNYISKEYESTDAYINEVMQMNALENEIIHAGQFLIIPYYSDEVK